MIQRCDCSSCDLPPSNFLSSKLPIPEEKPQGLSKFHILILGLVLSGSFTLIEYGVGWWSHSLSLIADSGHMLSDCLAMALSLAAALLAQLAASRRTSLGSRKAELFAALANAVGLIVVAVWIAWEACIRLQTQHPTVISEAMLLTAIAGLGFNLCTASLLHQHSHADLNIKGAFLHVLADTISSVGVILAALLIWLLHWSWADEIMSLITSVLISVSAFPLISQSFQSLQLSSVSQRDLR
jgi:cobalt-zinc-cadmium efflux system protein